MGLSELKAVLFETAYNAIALKLGRCPNCDKLGGGRFGFPVERVGYPYFCEEVLQLERPLDL